VLTLGARTRGLEAWANLLDFIVGNDDVCSMAYPGGKGRLFQRIISMMPPHEIYIETHLGGGAVMRHKTPAATNIGIDIDPSVISHAAAWRIPGLQLHNCDAIEFLAQFKANDKTLLYVDPPYLATTKKNRRYYQFEYSVENHIELLRCLCRLSCLVMISGYDSQLYTSELSDWNRAELINITHAGRRKELLWSNFEPTSLLHDYHTVGDSFRDRQRIKRKIDRWTKRLEIMPSVERNAIIAALLTSPTRENRLESIATDTSEEASRG
jgi:DNA adenine methylase